MGYAEEIFDRLESSGLRTKGEIQRWLAGPNRSPSSYSNFAVQLQEPFAIREQVNRTDDYDELRRLKRESQSLSISDNKTIRIINEKMNRIEKELARIAEERRLERERQEEQEKEVKRQEMVIARRLEREQERLFSDDKRKRENAKRQLEKMRERGQF